jgi:cytochrome b6-f complex iron-sulfur subunit
MDRKAFLRCMAAMTAGAAGLHLLAGCASVPVARFTLEGQDAVVPRADLMPDGMALLRIDTLPAPVFVAEHADGTVSAILLKCTHRGCTVQPAGPILQCPCHGSRYDHAGTVIRGPAPRNLTPLAVRAEGEVLRIDLSSYHDASSAFAPQREP